MQVDKLKDEDIEKYKMLNEILLSVFNEMKDFSKKKQDEVLNELKVKKINQLLKDIKDFLSKESSSDYLDLLDGETLPTNSDAVLILSQYRASMRNFHRKYDFY